MKKKICFLCPWMNNDGGLQRVVSNIANLLSREELYEIEICIISKYKDKPYYDLNPNIKVNYLPQIAKSNMSNFSRIIWKVINNLDFLCSKKIKKYIFFPLKRVKKLEEYILKNNFDCVIGVSGEITLLLSCINKNIISTKLIGWQHNSYDAYFKKRGEYYFGLEKLAKEYYKKLDKLVVLTKKDMEVYNKNMKVDCTYIYNPLSFNSEIKSNTSNKNLIFVGRLEWKQKGLDFLIKILRNVYKDSRSDGWKVSIVGDGTDSTKLKNKIEKENFSKNIKLLGKTDNVKEMYINADMLINTSRWEGFGLVITEAMECGLPIVAFDTDGPREIIDENSGYIISKYDIKEFSKKILLIMEDDAKRKNMSINAIERAKFFKEGKILKMWKEIIDL